MSLVYGTEAGGPSVILTDDAITSMVRHRQKTAKDNEAGGQLFARFDDSNTVIVEATEPKSLDRRTRCLFIPNRWLQQQEIKALHKQGKHFVGDWHTHPQAMPSPSCDDIDGMIDCFRKSRHELKAFIMVIVGNAEPPEGLLVCLIDGNGVTKLVLTATDG